MSRIPRRVFHASAVSAVGATMLWPSASARTPKQGGLPTVRFGNVEISRLLVGHNPMKGHSHFTDRLDREMLDHFADGHVSGRQLLGRCQQLGINTCQMGGEAMEELLRLHYAEGGSMQWIPTFYAAPGQGRKELARILQMDPQPIAVQHFGGTTDRLWREGKLDKALDTIKMLKDAGLMAGLCSHNWEVIDYAAGHDWEVDFYQGSFYRVGYATKNAVADFHPTRNEVFEEEARQGMARVLGQVAKPCIAFKVLGANRHCKTPCGVRRAIRYAFEKIKPTDVVLLGMWQKHRDQVAENVAFARHALGLA